ncbi:MAG: CBS domain-containing protein, partial [Pedosphaera parvula]|nr:CBS domain-containing protein [Pedosphaera parvula]
VLALCRERGFTRLPVCENTRDGQRVIGILSLRKLLFQADLDENRPAGELVTPALFLDADVRLELAMRRMQRSGQRMAIIVGRDQREIGILTLQDILKAIFGEVSL